jgi:hypothetical protein
MGTFHLACAASGLGIVCEDTVVVLLGRENQTRIWMPIAPPIAGNYDSYGRIDDIDFDSVAERTAAGFTRLYESNELVLSWPDDPRCVPSDGASPESLRSVLEDIRQAGLTSRHTLACGQELSYVIVLQNVYETAVDMVADSVVGRALAERLDASTFDVVVTDSLAAGALPRALVDDTSDTRAALVRFAQFRSWFDREQRWSPEHVGHQYSRQELRELVRAARKRFTKWPALVEAANEYERDSLRING